MRWPLSPSRDRVALPQQFFVHKSQAKSPNIVPIAASTTIQHTTFPDDGDDADLRQFSTSCIAEFYLFSLTCPACQLRNKTLYSHLSKHKAHISGCLGQPPLVDRPRTALCLAVEAFPQSPSISTFQHHAKSSTLLRDAVARLGEDDKGRALLMRQ
ncbi:hypothetical protein RRF57_010293 [Xylaria bambusicola]|uniref:Uncharacterized protein n=1 Tax=Xylaria bambusicola TaxID=326684 RepID=A0AAN7Z2L4_9PEZI